MSRLAELLLDWEERWEAGAAVTPEELCAREPELLDALRRAIGQLQRFRGIDEVAGADPQTPAHIGNYTVRRVLGAGATGVVYLAKDRALKRKVAIKVLSARLGLFTAADRERLAARFTREARTVAKLTHPAIVPIYEAALDGDEPYFVMEYLPGGSLQDRIRAAAGRPLGSAAEVAAFMADVIDAVGHAHASGIVHRDLKPGNILLDGAGRPRVTDFGLAKLVDEALWHEDSSASADARALPGDLGLTQLGRQPGTPAYMAPEQFDGRLGLVGLPTDIWAIGVILYEVLTGRHPFRGEGRAELQRQICSHPMTPPSAIDPHVDRSLERLTLRCLTREPQRRPTANDVARAIAAYLHPGPMRRIAGAAMGLWHGVTRRKASREGQRPEDSAESSDR
jgi:serine/threonine-protein kinase